ncbi:MAG: prephenate dehydratase [Acidobacteria bacterium]|nr:MAG: prephenate dehydratase [Acidobacteriota bacterium]PYU71653.1 MAG: prephenate dehydratase [Acidobacteriota bacterium]
MSTSDRTTMRVAFQGEPGAFSEAAAIQLLGGEIRTVPRATFEAAFTAIAEGAADALLAPVENSLAGSVVRVFDLLMESRLAIVAETILPIEMQLIAAPGASLADIRSVASHPMALAQCERFFAAHPQWKRVPAEDTAGSVREALSRGDKSSAAIAGRRAAEHYHGVILAESIQDNAENFTRFVLLLPEKESATWISPQARKVSLAMRLAHRPGALLASLEPFAKYGVNLLKIESRPIHGRPWEYQFFIDVEAETPARLDAALAEVRSATSELRVLGRYLAASR